MSDLTTISAGELAAVTGGARHAAPAGPFGFLDGLYKGAVFSIASNVGGKQLADKMYGGHASDRDRARAQAAMKQFLVAGNKLPKGVPNLFG